MPSAYSSFPPFDGGLTSKLPTRCTPHTGPSGNQDSKALMPPPSRPAGELAAHPSPTKGKGRARGERARRAHHPTKAGVVRTGAQVLLAAAAAITAACLRQQHGLMRHHWLRLAQLLCRPAQHPSMLGQVWRACSQGPTLLGCQRLSCSALGRECCCQRQRSRMEVGRRGSSERMC